VLAQKIAFEERVNSADMVEAESADRSSETESGGATAGALHSSYLGHPAGGPRAGGRRHAQDHERMTSWHAVAEWVAVAAGRCR
jgi:hypothetical protein